jgi:hypothetical protein
MFVALAVGFAILLYALSVVLQSYLYEQAASRMTLRAIASGLIAAGFLTFWVNVNCKADVKDKYGTLFEFNTTATKNFDEFTAVRRHVHKGPDGKVLESRRPFVKLGSGYFENKDPTKPLKLTTADYTVVAIEIPDGEAKARFEAELFVADETKPGEVKPVAVADAPPDAKFSRETVRYFREANGRRYIEFSQLGTPGSIQSPSRAAFFGALALNLLHFVVWLAIFWLVLRFAFGSALGLAAGFGLTIMLFVMPILFERGSAPPTPQAQVAPAP